MNNKKKVILERILSLLKTIGSANDAEDHGFLVDAERMRTQSCKALHDLLSENVFLTELLPTLEEELESKSILWVGWAELHALVEGKLMEVE